MLSRNAQSSSLPEQWPGSATTFYCQRFPMWLVWSTRILTSRTWAPNNFTFRPRPNHCPSKPVHFSFESENEELIRTKTCTKRLFQQLYSVVNLWLIKMQSLNNLTIQQCIANETLLLQVNFLFRPCDSDSSEMTIYPAGRGLCQLHFASGHLGHQLVHQSGNSDDQAVHHRALPVHRTTQSKQFLIAETMPPLCMHFSI